MIQSKKITLLGFAGSGKSIELEHLAHTTSSKDSYFYPLKISLNTYKGEKIEELLDKEYDGWSNIPPNQTLLIFDGLDEVNSKYFDDAVLSLNSFVKYFPDTYILISCRNNFYTTEKENFSAKLSDFKTFYILNLSASDIDLHLTTYYAQIKKSFLKEITRQKLGEIILNPFFFKLLIEIYLYQTILPANKTEIFELAIEACFKLDKAKYENTGVSIKENEVVLTKTIQKIALIMDYLGRSYLEEKELQQLITDKSLRDLLKYSFLFNKKDSEIVKWEFEHNNFREYLAAKELIKLTFQNIKALTSYDSNYEKIKPFWLNTLSFTFQLLDASSEKFKMLLEWMCNSEPSVLVRFEKDKIDLSRREQIIKLIYQESEVKGVILPYINFEYSDLITFVDESHEILKYLLSKLRMSSTNVDLNRAVRLLSEFKVSKIQDYVDEIENLLVEKLLSGHFSHATYLTVFYSLSKINTRDEKITYKLIKEFDFKSSKYTRAGMYKYLTSTNYHELYINVYLEGIEILNMESNNNSLSTIEDENVTLADESFQLLRGLEQSTSFDAVNRLIDYISKFKEVYLSEVRLNDLLRIALKNATTLHQKGQELYSKVIQLLETIEERASKENIEPFNCFFKNTNTTIDAFLHFYRQYIIDSDNDFEHVQMMSLLANDECCDYVVEQYIKGVLKDTLITDFRHLLSYMNKPMHDYFYKEINAASGNKFVYVQKPSFEEIKREKSYHDLDLILDHSSFQAEVNQVFLKLKKDELNQRDLTNYQHNRLGLGEIHHEIIIRFLMNEAGKATITKERTDKILNDHERWTWLQIHTLIRYDIDNGYVSLRDKDISIIQQWCEINLTLANFDDAIVENPEGGVSYRYREVFLAYCAQRFDFPFLEDSLLDMLKIYCNLIPSRNKTDERENLSLVKYLVDKFGVEKVKERVLANLKAGIGVKAVLQRHFKICDNYNFSEALPYMKKEIFSKFLKDYQKKELLRYYFSLGGDPYEFEGAIGLIDSEIKQNLIDHLIKLKVPFVEDYLIQNITSASEEASLYYSKKLLEIGNFTGLDYLNRWVFTHRKYPSLHISNEMLLKIKDNRLLPTLITMYEAPYKLSFEVDDLYRVDSALLEVIKELGSQNEANYGKVKSTMLRFIQDYDLRFFYYQMDELEQRFYSKLGSNKDFSDALLYYEMLD
ncbi:hypothetical protein OKW21_005527 [Catalinimonas alkaloidigena]|uniref:NACHT domain-containing protein n=1 Tax=Catalinimonas alkaloidigena TaxID=1075417 RepID=UPI002405ADEC|nr:hypothetical protein [Catalinimonas alkaloidigena]MDF9800264.1 hypothetical protein [Catalinimonas alkaloidigena]